MFTRIRNYCCIYVIVITAAGCSSVPKSNPPCNEKYLGQQPVSNQIASSTIGKIANFILGGIITPGSFSTQKTSADQMVSTYKKYECEYQQGTPFYEYET